MSEMLKILLMGLGCSSLLGLGSCMMFTGSMVYLGSKSADVLREKESEKPDPWRSETTHMGPSKGVPRAMGNGDVISGAGRYGEPNMPLKQDERPGY